MTESAIHALLKFFLLTLKSLFSKDDQYRSLLIADIMACNWYLPILYISLHFEHSEKPTTVLTLHLFS